MNYEILAIVGLVAAALMAGLWWGERGRRKAAENWVVTGTPEAPKAVSMAPSKEAEDRFAESVQEYSKESVDRGVAEIMEAAREKGVSISEEDARREVETMFYGEDVNSP